MAGPKATGCDDVTVTGRGADELLRYLFVGLLVCAAEACGAAEAGCWVVADRLHERASSSPDIVSTSSLGVGRLGMGPSGAR
jgi:hypothetical protein